MGEIVVQAFITLDGVVQAPGGSQEDTEAGFPYGGWQFDYEVAEVGALIEEWEQKTEALLLGRTTYEIFAGAWGVWDEDAPGLEGELTRRYNRVPKYVASRTLGELGWKNSQLLGADVPASVGRLRNAQQGEIRVWGSGGLIGSLSAHDLVDEYRLVVYPLVLGTGKRLFSDGFAHSRFSLAESTTLPQGVVVNRYRRAG